MVRLADSFTAAHEVVLLDPGVLRDVAVSLSGLWRPGDERDPLRRRQLIAAAQIRLYGAAADRSGWSVVTVADAHDKANERDADWSAGFIPGLEGFDDAPSTHDTAALVKVLHEEEGLDGESARTLALALLCEAVTMVVTRDPLGYQHQRSGDLPSRLEIVDAPGAVARLALAPGEPAWIDPLEGSMLAEGEHWWVPGGEAAGGDPGAG